MNSWLKIEKIEFKKCNELLKELINSGVHLSPWISNIVEKYDYRYSNYAFPLNLVRINVKDLDFNGPAELSEIYKKSAKLNLELVPPEIAIYTRKLYTDQPKGEWLRFATPFDSMIDTDGVPHLPKLGSALNLKFIETYWAYKKAIFHPHNEFVFLIK